MSEYKPLLKLQPGQEGLLKDVQDLMLVGNMAIQRIDYDLAIQLDPELKAYGAMQYYSTVELVGIVSKIVEQIDIQCARLGVEAESWMDEQGFLLNRSQAYCMLGRNELVRQKLRE